MTDFLLEIFSEEIPAKMQKTAVKNFSKIASDVFTKHNLSYKKSQIKTFITPTRLVLEIKALQDVQKVPEKRRVGPKITADKKAVAGFLKSVGLSDKSELKTTEHNGAVCYLFVSPASQTDVVKIIKESLQPILQKMAGTWPKMMRWDIEGSDKQPKWVRPIRNILCIFGSDIVDLEFAGLQSNNVTFGHYGTAGESFSVKSLDDYKEILKKNSVILDQEERRKIILGQISDIKNKYGLETIDAQDSALVDEVVGLCQFPTAMLGNISERFMHLPDEVLILTLKMNQKYFCLKNDKDELISQFIFIADAIIVEGNQEKIILDNEKLVNARLSDAQFFIEEDLKTPLVSRHEELKHVLFHQKLGSVYDKTVRLKVLAKFLAIFVPRSSLSLVERAVDLSKNDLVTKAVAELPELQGKIGSFYAQKQGEDLEIASAIYEHYLPQGIHSSMNAQLPKTPLGITLAISDKMDSIVGFFLAGEKPSSSKDPFALRRAALGIIRIGFKYNIAFPIRILVQKSIHAYPTKLAKELLSDRPVKFFEAKKKLEEEIVVFFVERLKAYLKETEQVKPDIINAVIDGYLADLENHKSCDILYLAKKSKFLDSFVREPANHNIIELYKRSSHMLAIEEKKDGKKYTGKHTIIATKTKYEVVLFRRTKQIRAEFKRLVIKGEFESAFKMLSVLEGPLTHFFEHVIVNHEDKTIREDRLQILARVRSLFDLVADLSKIEF